MAIYEKYPAVNEGQYLFDTSIKGLWFFIKLAFKLFIYFPLVFIGYLIAAKFLDKNAHGLLWFTAIAFFAYLIYLFLYFLKGVVLSLKFRHNFLWVPLFFIAVTFACVLPIWLIWNTAANLIGKMGGDETMQWIFAIAFFVYIYMRYNFLTNIAPVFAFPAYHAGFHITNRLFKITSFKAAKSKEVI